LLRIFLPSHQVRLPGLGCDPWMNGGMAEVFIRLKRCTRHGARHDFMFRLLGTGRKRVWNLLLIFAEKEANKVQRYNNYQL